MPIDTAEPLTILIAPLRSIAFKSCIFSFAIFSISEELTLPTKLLPGVELPFLIFAAFFK